MSKYSQYSTKDVLCLMQELRLTLTRDEHGNFGVLGAPEHLSVDVVLLIAQHAYSIVALRREYYVDDETMESPAVQHFSKIVHALCLLNEEQQRPIIYHLAEGFTPGFNCRDLRRFYSAIVLCICSKPEGRVRGWSLLEPIGYPFFGFEHVGQPARENR